MSTRHLPPVTEVTSTMPRHGRLDLDPAAMTFIDSTGPTMLIAPHRPAQTEG
ncbi:hypothetical protein ACFXEL_24420 [Streptomyces sp. NPDC059382]|uniref:hypothetical protein n=1 Tax=Streptomyces sp. NPDC059382 TaxID=3346816 RepID=UPI003680B3FD